MFKAQYLCKDRTLKQLDYTLTCFFVFFSTAKPTIGLMCGVTKNSMPPTPLRYGST